jgi:hypothetical protein
LSVFQNNIFVSNFELLFQQKQFKAKQFWQNTGLATFLDNVFEKASGRPVSGVLNNKHSSMRRCRAKKITSRHCTLVKVANSDRTKIKTNLNSIQSRVARFFSVQHTKTGKNIPNDDKIHMLNGLKYTK